MSVSFPNDPFPSGFELKFFMNFLSPMCGGGAATCLARLMPLVVKPWVKSTDYEDC